MLVVSVSSCPPEQARFARNSLEDVATMIGERVPASTKRTTSQWYCEEAHISVDLENDSLASLCKTLALCYVNCRSKTGQPYQRASLMGLRAALARHISSILFFLLHSLQVVKSCFEASFVSGCACQKWNQNTRTRGSTRCITTLRADARRVVMHRSHPRTLV